MTARRFVAPLLALPALAAPASVAAQDWRATCLAAGGGQERVAACGKALVAAPGDLALRRALARAYLDVGDGPGATGEYGALAADRPDDAEAWFDYGLALATDNRLKEAAVAVDRALKLNPDDRQIRKLAVLAYEGVGRHADAYAASLWLADLGDAIAMYDVAVWLMEGRGVDADPPAAVPWFKRAAEAGHAGAMAALARIYAEGLHGQARDPAAAAEWAKKAQ
jgi:TPR repeat protein